MKNKTHKGLIKRIKLHSKDGKIYGAKVFRACNRHGMTKHKNKSKNTFYELAEENFKKVCKILGK